MKSLKLIPLAFCFLFFGCEDALDCIFNKRPEIPDKSFKIGHIDNYYYEDFTSEIKNEPRDDDYGYTYEIYEDLPDGLEIYANYRTLSIEGNPTALGTFTFTVYLYVDPPVHYDDYSGEYESSMCSESTSKEFTITIN
jgi:hypothetical protein